MRVSTKTRILNLVKSKNTRHLEAVLIDAVYNSIYDDDCEILHYTNSEGEIFQTLEEVEARYPDCMYLKLVITKA